MALGLRTLTVQTGQALQSGLALADAKQMELNAVSRRYGEIELRITREEETEQ